MDANLLISFDPTHAGKAEEEVKALFSEVGEKPEFLKRVCVGAIVPIGHELSP